jgi:hypothetical protein
MTGESTQLLPRYKWESSCMKKLDGVGWADGICVRAYGLRIGIRVNDKTVMKQVPDRLPFGCKPARSSVVDCLYSVLVAEAQGQSNIRRFNLLYANATRLARTLDLEEMLTELEANLHSQATMAMLRKLVSQAPVLQGVRGEADEIVDSILNDAVKKIER